MIWVRGVGVMVGDKFVCCVEEIFRLSLFWISWFIRPWTACWLWRSRWVLVCFLSGLDLFFFPFIIMLLLLRDCTSLFFCTCLLFAGKEGSGWDVIYEAYLNFQLSSILYLFLSYSPKCLTAC